MTLTLTLILARTLTCAEESGTHHALLALLRSHG